jgi:hypothetical protein
MSSQKTFTPEEEAEIRTLALDEIKEQPWSLDFIERIVQVIATIPLVRQDQFCPHCQAGLCGQCGKCHLIYPLTGERCEAYRDTVLGCWEWKEAFIAINAAIDTVLDKHIPG